MFSPPATWTNQDDGTAARLVASWPYLPELGEAPHGYVARYEGDRGKAVVPFFRPDGPGRFRAGAAPEPRPLFGLHTLSRAGSVFATEGEKPAAALHCLGFAAVTSPGGSRAAAKADWEPVRRRREAGTELVLWPDHDAPGRAYAAAVAAIVGPGCACLLSPPPGTPNEAGADGADWLTAALAELGRAWDGLRPPKLTEGERREIRGRLSAALDATPKGPPPRDWSDRPETKKHNDQAHRWADDGPPAYVANARGIFRIVKRGDGVEELRLSNFTAHITEEVKRDDALEQSLTLTIEGVRQGATLPAVTLSVDLFERMSWPVKHWGTACLVNPGQGARDHLKHAIQYLSHRRTAAVAERTVYTHTGWRKTATGWVYLTAGGAIGAAGQVPGVEVDLGELGELYRLPPSSRTPAERTAAAVASLEAANVAPPDVSIPLFAAAYLAPLAGTLHPDLTLWLEGPSRSMKSTLAALVAAHFGAGIERTALAASWLDTFNAIGYKLFVLADTLAVVDDYAPQRSAADQARLDTGVERILRGVGNGAGRGRLTADIRLQATRRPRALALCTGEQWPTGESIIARLFGVTVAPGSVDVERLTLVQSDAKHGILARAMAGHLSAAAGDFDRYHAKGCEDWRGFRGEAMEAGLTGRTPEQAAYLLTGYRQALGHWQSCGAVTEREASALFADARAVIFKLAGIHERRVFGAQPADAFVRILADLLLTGAAHLRDTEDRCPVNADRYGWKGDTTEGPHIGWVNEPNGELYLLQDAALDAVTTRARRADTALNIRPAALWRQLRDRGFLVDAATEEREDGAVRRNTRQVRIGTKRPRVLVMPLSVLTETDGDQAVCRSLR